MGVIEATFCYKTPPSCRNEHRKIRKLLCLCYLSFFGAKNWLNWPKNLISWYFLILMGVIEVTFCSKISPSPRNRHKKTWNCFVYAWQTFWILYTNVSILALLSWSSELSDWGRSLTKQYCNTWSTLGPKKSRHITFKQIIQYT